MDQFSKPGNVVEWGDARFQINKLLPIEAKDLFVRHVRPLCRGALSASTGDGNAGQADTWRIILAAFSDAPTDHYEAISRAMSGAITCTRGGESRIVRDNEAWCFQGLEGAHAVVLDGRAFVINFFDWLPVVASEFPSLLQAFNQSESETETLSSPTS